MWKRVEGKKIKESVSSNQQHWRRERHQIDQQWAGTMLKKKKEDLLAIKLNCLGHIWQEKCELEAANIAQIISICWKSANHKCDEEMEFQIAFQSWLEVV